jgi:SAM-dependent methyltransferase
MIGQSSIAGDPLLRQVLVSGRVSDGEVERVLTLARRGLLRRARAGERLDPTLLEFFCALAQQCFLNEYVFAESDDERSEVARLAEAIEDRLGTDGDVAPAEVIAVAAYRPLHELAGAQTLLERAWTPSIEQLLTQQIREPREEPAIRESLPALTAIDDAISQAVRDQYEANPYPRWVTAAPPMKALRIDDYIRGKFPRAPVRPLGAGEHVDILVAGCGTGLHPIEAAQKYAGARVLAVDLSRASLAYATRKTRALGLPVDYAQADILALGGLDRRFDVIEACGSLQCLQDPSAGWRVLLRLLKPGGLMLLGLYSRTARREINEARAFIAQRGYRGTADEIRRFRQEAFGWPDDMPAKSVTRLGDFYSTSCCRDLLFHVQEYQHDLPEIAAFIAAEQLQFVGFDLDVRILQAYAAANPEDPAMIDLERWHRFELAHPAIFATMYQFWVQKP